MHDIRADAGDYPAAQVLIEVQAQGLLIEKRLANDAPVMLD